MRALCIGLCLLATSLTVGARSAADLLKEADDAANAVAQENVGAPRGGGGAAPGAAADLSGCSGASRGGRISLLGVQSDMGPSTQGMSPVMKLGPQHPAMKSLAEMQTRLGMSNANTPAADAARQRKALADSYDFHLGAQRADASRSRNSKGGYIGSVAGWVYGDQLEAMAKAYAEQQQLAQQYAALYAIAEAAGRACP